MILVLGLQSLLGATTLIFGVVALLVSGRIRGSTLQANAWLITGLAFTLEGVSSAIQSTGAIGAVMAGEGSMLYSAYLRWSPVGNHGRGFLKIGLGLALIALPLSKRIPSKYLPVVISAWCVGFVILGSLFGWSEGALRAKHFSTVAVFDLIEMVVTGIALFAALFTGGMDRLLWISLAINVFRQALNVIWTSAMAWRDTPGAWAPSAAQMQMYACVALILMIGFALRCLRLASEGRMVGELLEPVTGKRLPMLR